MSATPATGVWPFLVARGRRLGYRVVVVPEFLADRGEGGLLYPVVESGDSGSPGDVRRQMLGTRAGRSVSVVFREVIVDAADLGLAAGPLRDTFGRAVSMFEGYAADGPTLPSVTDWRPAHEIAAAAMRSMLAAEGRGAGPEDIVVTVSQPVPLSAEPDRPPARGNLTKMTIVLVATGVLVLAMVITGLALL